MISLEIKNTEILGEHRDILIDRATSIVAEFSPTYCQHVGNVLLWEASFETRNPANEYLIRKAYEKAREKLNEGFIIYLFRINARFYKDIKTLKEIFRVADELKIDLDDFSIDQFPYYVVVFGFFRGHLLELVIDYSKELNAIGEEMSRRKCLEKSVEYHSV
jgi:hypothetical protein